MDVQMPVMDGYAATRRIRGELGLEVPILAMTAGDLPSERELCIAAGMDGFVSKPFQPDNLQLSILKCIRKRARPDHGGGAPERAESPRMTDESPTGVVPGVFEPDRLVGMLGGGEGSADVVRKLVRQFIELTPGTLREGRVALERGDAVSATRACHNLKATAASLGAMALSDAAKKAEEVLVDQGGPGPSDAFAGVETEFARIEGPARRWLSTNQG